MTTAKQTPLKIEVSDYFYVLENDYQVCCGEIFETHYCNDHDEPHGCIYCEFDYSKPCDCDGGE